MTGLTAPYIANHIQVVQAIAGCIQLRALAPNSNLWLDSIRQQLQQQVGVYSVHKDATTDNLVILFDPNLLPLPQLLGILQQWGVGGVSGQQTVTTQVGSFLQEHHEFETLLPMIAGMLVTQTLRLRGGWALLANVMAATVTRQAIAQLEETSTSAPSGVAVEPVVQPTAVSQPTTPPPEETVQTSSVAVIHAIPGRVRLRVPQLTNDPDYTQRLQKLLSSDELITHVRINAQAASIAITYEIGEISDDELQSHLIHLIHSIDPDNFNTQEESLTPPPASDSTTQVFNECCTQISSQSSTKEHPTTEQHVQTISEDALNYFKPSFVCSLFNSLANRMTAKAQV